MGTLISIISDSPFERRGLQATLEDDGWEIMQESAPLNSFPADNVIALISCQDANRRDQYLAEFCTAPGVKTLALVPTHDQTELWTCVQGGADSVLCRDADLPVLLGTLRLLESGQRVMPCEMKIHSSPAGNPSEAAGLKQLSARERQVLMLVMQGLPNKVIARHLILTEATVKVHLKAILRKLDVQNRTKAAIVAHSHGFGEEISQLAETPIRLPEAA